jgi:hypothetical protein
MNKPVFDLTLYDAAEVYPVARRSPDVADPEVLEACDEKDPQLAYWSVFLHLKEGGLECIADCASKVDAYFIAEALERAFPSLTSRGMTDWCEVTA